MPGSPAEMFNTIVSQLKSEALGDAVVMVCSFPSSLFSFLELKMSYFLCRRWREQILKCTKLCSR